MKIRIVVVLCLLIFIAVPMNAGASEPLKKVKGQTVYVPAYSHIYIGSKGTPYLLAVTLSIRNISLVTPIRITEVSYYQTQGEFLKNYITAPVSLGPLAATRYIVHQKDKQGGSGANFIVKWEADKPSNPPIIEAIMIGTQSQQGISFTSRGVVVSE